MANELTHGLAATATASIINLSIGNPAITPFIFIAGFIGMLINLDRGGSMNGSRTPYGHSLAFGILWLYVAVITVYFLNIFNVMPISSGISFIIAFGAAYFSHLALDAFSNEGIFILPLSKGGKNHDWSNWTRLSLAGPKKATSSGELNMALVSVMMACIALA